MRAELGSMDSAMSNTLASSVYLADNETPDACAAVAARLSTSVMFTFSSPPSLVKNLKPFLLYGKWDAVMMMPPSYS